MKRRVISETRFMRDGSIVVVDGDRAPEPPPASISLCPQAWRYRRLMDHAWGMAVVAAGAAVAQCLIQAKYDQFERDLAAGKFGHTPEQLAR